MGRIMAFDYGIKTTGIAVTDTENIISIGLTSIETKNILIFIKKYLQCNNVSRFLIGIPNGKRNFFVILKIQNFILKLTNLYKEIKIHTIDENFTTKIANQYIINNKKFYKKKNCVYENEISAIIMLKEWLKYYNKI
ncbi:MAG: RuvX/YqgF family protein [Bacteroides sp.]|nr:MAG: RuvX/YqgF family protein [Bacteroides sp.]